MSYNNLKKFVKEQAIREEDPERLKEGLILNGWERGDVEKAIKEVYGLKKRIKKTGITIIIILILIFSVSLLLLFNELYTESDEPKEEPSTKIEEEPEEKTGCAAKDEIEAKEQCYLDKIKEGYYCENLSSEETFYCNRVLETYIMDAYNS